MSHGTKFKSTNAGQPSPIEEETPCLLRFSVLLARLFCLNVYREGLGLFCF